jgi:hypothetical protein
MTDAGWLECTSPETMLEYLRGRASERKLRLFAVACCRQVWRMFADDTTRQVVEVAECFADGQASETDLEAARQTAEAAVQRATAWFGQLTGGGAWHGPREAMPAGLLAAGLEWATAVAAAVAASERDLPSAAEEAALQVKFALRNDEDTKAVAPPLQEVYEVADRAQCALLRDIFGNPFRPITINSTWLTPVVVSLAQATYDNRDLPAGTLQPDRLAVLADALEEVGAGGEVVEHLRSPGPHIRGCFVLDLLLGKE